MKYIVAVLLLALSVFGAGFLVFQPGKQPAAPISDKVETQSEAIGIPNRLKMPSIGVDAAIISLSQDERGRMDIPSNPEQVGWYAPGYRVGQNGTAVLAAHLDRADGSPAVFYKLNELRKGDVISVLDDQGQEYRFLVDSKAIYQYDRLPLDSIFNMYGTERLTLITCEGDFVNGNYTDRLVIYTIAEPAD